MFDLRLNALIEQSFVHIVAVFVVVVAGVVVDVVVAGVVVDVAVVVVVLPENLRPNVP